MAERSYPWTGDRAEGAIGDAGPYGSDDLHDWFRPLLCGDRASQAVIPFYKNKLEVTTPSNELIDIRDGAAFVNGVLYTNTGSTHSVDATDPRSASLIAMFVAASGDDSTLVDFVATKTGTYTASPVLVVDYNMPLDYALRVDSSDGVADYVDCTSATASFNGSEGTVAAWFMVTTASAFSGIGDQVVVSLVNNASNYFVISVPATADTITYKYKTNDVGQGLDTDFTQASYLNTWAHAAMTWSATASTIVYYLDGASVGSDPASAWAGGSLTAFYIGNWNTSGTDYAFQGDIGPVMLWSTPLAASDVSALYSAGSRWGLVKSTVQKSTAAVAGQTTYYRAVLRSDYTTQTVRTEIIGGTATAPTPTQIDGTNWENSLALITVAADGTTTVTDERDYLKFNLMAASDNFSTDMASITATQRESRRREFIVPPNSLWNNTDNASIARAWNGLYSLPGDKDVSVYGEGAVPVDSTGNLFTYALVESSGRGNLVCQGSTWNAITDGTESVTGTWGYDPFATGTRTETIAANTLSKCASQFFPLPPLAGEHLYLRFKRLGATCAADTLSASLYFYGWLVSYLADS